MNKTNNTQEEFIFIEKNRVRSLIDTITALTIQVIQLENKLKDNNIK